MIQSHRLPRPVETENVREPPVAMTRACDLVVVDGIEPDGVGDAELINACRFVLVKPADAGLNDVEAGAKPARSGQPGGEIPSLAVPHPHARNDDL